MNEPRKSPIIGLPFGKLCHILSFNIIITVTNIEKYILLLSIVQSDPTHTLPKRTEATGFSFKEPSSGL